MVQWTPSVWRPWTHLPLVPIFHFPRVVLESVSRWLDYKTLSTKLFTFAPNKRIQYNTLSDEVRDAIFKYSDTTCMVDTILTMLLKYCSLSLLSNPSYSVAVLGCLIRGGKFVSVGRQIFPLWGASCRPIWAARGSAMGRLCHQRRSFQYISPQKSKVYQISVAVQLLARHLEMNCQYKMFAY